MTYTPWTSRTVGIEMELLHAGRERGTHNTTTSVAVAMRAAFTAYDCDPSTIRDCGGWASSNGGRTWDCKTDATSGLEIASRAIRFDETGHNAELKAACSVLTRVGKLNSSCGLHVHVDVSDFTRADFQRLLALWYRYEPFFYSLVSPSRADNYYCKPTRTASWNRNTGRCWSEAAARRALTATTDGAMRSALHDLNHWGVKYSGMNISPFPMHGRVEFRLHHGTLNYTKIRSWVMWLTALVNRAKATHVSPVKRQVPAPLSAGALAGYAAAGLSPWRIAQGLGLLSVGVQYAAPEAIEEMCSWANARRAAFRRGEPTSEVNT